MKVLFVGDPQIGSGLDLGYGEYGAGSRFHDQEAVLGRIADLAIAQEVGLVCLLGDVFERATPKPWEILAVQNFVRRLTDEGIRVLILVGNHDLKSASLPTILEVFAGIGVIVSLLPGIFPLDDIVIAALPWTPPNRLIAENGDGHGDVAQRVAELVVAQAKLLGDSARDDFPGLTPILVGHWPVSGGALPTGLPTSQMGAVLDLSAVAQAGFKVCAFGDVHMPQVLTKSPSVVFHAGSPMVCNWGETGFQHGVWLYNSAGAGSLKMIPVDDRPFITFDPDPETLADGAYVLPVDDGAMVRLRYTCTEEQARRIDQAQIRKALMAGGAAKVFIRQTIEREVRARVEAMQEGLGEAEALELWLSTQDGIENADKLRRLHGEYLQRVRA